MALQFSADLRLLNGSLPVSCVFLASLSSSFSIYQYLSVHSSTICVFVLLFVESLWHYHSISDLRIFYNTFYYQDQIQPTNSSRKVFLNLYKQLHKILTIPLSPIFMYFNSPQTFLKLFTRRFINCLQRTRWEDECVRCANESGSKEGWPEVRPF